MGLQINQRRFTMPSTPNNKTRLFLSCSSSRRVFLSPFFFLKKKSLPLYHNKKDNTAILQCSRLLLIQRKRSFGNCTLSRLQERKEGRKEEKQRILIVVNVVNVGEEGFLEERERKKKMKMMR